MDLKYGSFLDTVFSSVWKATQISRLSGYLYIHDSIESYTSPKNREVLES